MKIGILTFHRCINYGSYWQTRCLAGGIQSRGHDVKIMNHQSRKIDIAEWKCALQPVLPTPIPKSDSILYRQKIEKFLDAFNNLPLTNPFQLENPEEIEDFDLVIIGSDEVWNLNHPWYANCPLFYGEGIRSGKLISYAASFGNFDPSIQLNQIWIKRLHNFDKISVRDDNSKLIIQNTLGFEPEVVLDPCIQFPIENEVHLHQNFKRPYAAVYGHNFSNLFVRAIKEWADEKKITLISIGYRNNWADEQWISADPNEFPEFFSQSEAVITNFFHGCIFALINEKPFVCETSSYRSNKVEDLLSKLEIQNRLIKSSAHIDYDFLLSKPLEKKIQQKITLLRHLSNNWLDHALLDKN